MRIDKEVLKVLNESDGYTFADWFGQDLTGQTYEGDINCSDQGLTSLKGAPQEISGRFDCSYNQLTSLEGAPQKVSGNFWCNDNQLTTLEGAPQQVSGNFRCYFNQLTSLEGAPQEVGEDFNCSRNKLTSLEGGPQKVSGNFYCYRNNLTTLEGAPQYIGGNFNCDDNNLTTLEGAPQTVGGDFSCDDNLKDQAREMGYNVDIKESDQTIELKNEESELTYGVAKMIDRDGDVVLQETHDGWLHIARFDSLDNGYEIYAPHPEEDEFGEPHWEFVRYVNGEDQERIAFYPATGEIEDLSGIVSKSMLNKLKELRLIDRAR